MSEALITKTLLPVVLVADNFPSSPFADPYPTRNPLTGERLVPFHLTFADHHAALPPLGYVRPDVLAELEKDERDPSICPWQFHSSAVAQEDGDLDLRVECVFFADWVVEGGKEIMGKIMQDTAERWKGEGKFPGPLGGWRNEKYSVYAPRQSSAFKGKADASGSFSNFAFALERSACALFGLATFGVHLTAYEGEGSDMKIWVPRRSATKPTFPGLLDNTVAGGIPSGMKPIDAMIKECDEEASLPEDFVKPRLKNVGLATYFYLTDDGYFQPEVEYLYDLPLPPQSSKEYIKPRPHDDEVESFALLSLKEVIESLHKLEFKPNCGLILIDFLMRHGFITPENEPNYVEIAWRMRRRLAVTVPM